MLAGFTIEEQILLTALKAFSNSQEVAEYVAPFYVDTVINKHKVLMLSGKPAALDEAESLVRRTRCAG